MHKLSFCIFFFLFSILAIAENEIFSSRSQKTSSFSFLVRSVHTEVLDSDNINEMILFLFACDSDFAFRQSDTLLDFFEQNNLLAKETKKCRGLTEIIFNSISNATITFDQEKEPFKSKLKINENEKILGVWVEVNRFQKFHWQWFNTGGLSKWFDKRANLTGFNTIAIGWLNKKHTENKLSQDKNNWLVVEIWSTDGRFGAIQNRLQSY